MREQRPITQSLYSTTLSRVSDTLLGACSRHFFHRCRNSKDDKLSPCTINVIFYSSDGIGKHYTMSPWYLKADTMMVIELCFSFNGKGRITGDWPAVYTQATVVE
jgi:hypothetical protein